MKVTIDFTIRLTPNGDETKILFLDRKGQCTAPSYWKSNVSTLHRHLTREIRWRLKYRYFTNDPVYMPG